jgi:carbon monoxide dehydrogenase subunit G
MSIVVAIELGYEFTVKASADAVFALLADVPASAAHFPRVHRLVDVGGGIYRWEMERVGLAQITHQTIYTSRYVADRERRVVSWTPEVHEGNARIGGSWAVSTRGKATHLVLKVEGEMTIPLPALMQSVVAPVVRGEFAKMVETYIDNLVLHFGGAP